VYTAGPLWSKVWGLTIQALTAEPKGGSAGKDNPSPEVESADLSYFLSAESESESAEMYQLS
jgi:hypothetical protein